MDRSRHGRYGRTPIDGRRRPADGYRVVDLPRFRRLVEEALHTLPPALQQALAGARVQVTDLPEDLQGHEVTLVRCEARGSAVDVLRVHRRPFESRAASRSDLLALLREVLVDEICLATGIPSDEPPDDG